MKRRHWWTAGTVTTALAVAMSCLGPVAGAAPGTGGGGDDPLGPDPTSPWVVRESSLPVTQNEWEAYCDGTSDPVDVRTLELFHDVTVTAESDLVEYDAQQDVISWTGHVQYAEDLPVVLTVEGACRGEGPQLSGRVDQGETAYVLQPTQDGATTVVELDMRGEPGAAGNDSPVPPDAPPTDEGTRSPALPGPRQQPGAAPVTVDVTPGFTPRALQYLSDKGGMAGGVAAIEATANKSLADSGVTSFRFRFTAPWVFNYDGDEAAATVLKAVTPADSAPGKQMRAMREKANADLAALFTDVPRAPGAGYTTGVAYLGSSIADRPDWTAENTFYSVQDITAAMTFNTTAHEMGHNLSLLHDDKVNAANNSKPPAQFYDARGWVLPGGKHHTNLAYNSSCPGPCSKLFQYSRPGATYNGEPVGDSQHNNARVIGITGPIASEYRTAPAPPVQHALTVTSSPSYGGTATAAHPGPFEPGTQVAVSAQPQPGYVFQGWTLDGADAGTANPTSVLMDKAHTLTARFARDPVAPTHTLSTSVTPDGGGAVELSPAKAGYDPGEPVVATAKPAEGYTFQEWRIGSSSRSASGRSAAQEPDSLLSSSPKVTVSVDEDLALRAVFKRAENTLTLRPTGGGTLTRSDPGPYADGDTVAVQANPAKYRKLIRWTIDDERVLGAPNPLTLTMNSPTTLAARFGCARTPSGAIGKKWRAEGGRTGLLHCATAKDRAASGEGRLQTFQGGIVYASKGGKASIVRDPFRRAWSDQRLDRGPLRYPLAERKTLPVRDGKWVPRGVKLPTKGRYQRFKGGLLVWDAAAKRTRVHLKP